MPSFKEIEDCFPEDGATTEENGVLCSAQWLHDFARAVAKKEREACAKIADAVDLECPNGIGIGCEGDADTIAARIRERSN
jgi:hypothetical protein